MLMCAAVPLGRGGILATASKGVTALEKRAGRARSARRCGEAGEDGREACVGLAA